MSESISHRDVFIEETVNSILSRPELERTLHCAALPLWLPPGLYDAIQTDKSDGAEADILPRLERQFSFVGPLNQGRANEGAPGYVIEPRVRRAILEHWIKGDRAAFAAAHHEALEFQQEFPDPNTFAQHKNHLYHLFFVDLTAAGGELIDRFRQYAELRLFAAIERLLDVTREALELLALMGSEDDDFPGAQQLVAFLYLRLDQIRERERSQDEVSRQIEALRNDPNLRADLLPFVARANAISLAMRQEYDRAIKEFKVAIKAFGAQRASPYVRGRYFLEVADTRVLVGDAYADFAAALQALPMRPAPKPTGAQWFRSILFFVLSLPVVLYLTRTMGRAIWRVKLGPLLFRMDWFVARLYGDAFQQYNQARRDTEDARSEVERNARSLADSGHLEETEFTTARKLSEAFIALQDGDAAIAALKQVPDKTRLWLDPYRQSVLNALEGLGHWHAGRIPLAQLQLQVALPDLIRYQDNALTGDTLDALAECALAQDDKQQAIKYLLRAIDHYTNDNKTDAATAAAERIEPLLGASLADSETRMWVNEALPVRTYPVAFRNPWVKYVIALLVALLAAMVVLIPTVLIAERAFTLDFEVSFGLEPTVQGFTNAETSFVGKGWTQNAEVKQVTETIRPVLAEGGIGGAILIGAIYLVLALIAAWALVEIPPLRWIEERVRTRRIELSATEVRQGNRTIRLADADRLIAGNSTIAATALPDFSSTSIHDREQYINIGAGTQGYRAIRQRLEERMRTQGSVTIDELRLSRSKSALLYVLFAALLAVLVAAAFQGRPETEWEVIPDRYRLFDLYPLLLFGMALVPLYLFYVRPMRLRVLRDPQSHWPLYGVAAGCGLYLVLVALDRFSPLSAMPTLLLLTVALYLLFTALVTLWKGRAATRKPKHRWLRPATAALAVLFAVLMLGAFSVHALAFYRLNTAYTMQSNLAEITVSPTRQGGVGEQMRDLAVGAMDSYTRVSNYAPPDFGISGPLALWIDHLVLDSSLERLKSSAKASSATLAVGIGPLGIIDQETLSQTIAGASDEPPLLMMSALQAGANQRQRAIQDLERALQIQGPTALTAEQRALANLALGWNYLSSTSQDIDPNTEAGMAALRTLADNAFTHFAAVTATESLELDALLGMGFAHYVLREYDEALERASQVQNPALVDSTGIANAKLLQGAHMLAGATHWRIGGQTGKAVAERCKDYDNSLASFEAAAGDTMLADASVITVAYAHRTAGQIIFLLQDLNCAGYEDNLEALGMAAQKYSDALEVLPADPSYNKPRAIYIQMRARLHYAQWTVADLLQEQRLGGLAFLEEIESDLQEAIKLEPVDDTTRGVDYRPSVWLERVRSTIDNRRAVLALLSSPSIQDTGSLRTLAPGQQQAFANYLCGLGGDLSQIAEAFSLPSTLVWTPEPVAENTAPLYLAFNRDSEVARTLWVREMASGVVMRVPVNRRCDASEPAFSPDGGILAFQARCIEPPTVDPAEVQPGAFEIYTIDLPLRAGSVPEPLSSLTDTVQAMEPRYSPDGSKIVFRTMDLQAATTNANGPIHQMNPDGSQIEALPVQGRTPSFSADGESLLYMATTNERWNLFVANADGTEQRQLTQCAISDCRFPAWSPEGDEVVYNHMGQGIARTSALTDTFGSSAIWINGGSRPSWSAIGDVAYNLPGGGIFAIHAADLSPDPQIVDACGYAPKWSR